MKQLSDEKIVESWKRNVHPWVTAIREGEIASRVLTTNKAVLSAVMDCAPRKVLDVGCGEGWLVRELANSGIDALGIDAIPGFIDFAKKEGGGRFKVLAYEDVSAKALKEKFDLVVCNFSLLGKESVENLFQQFPSILEKGGTLVVQTIHPVAGVGKSKYEDGWREGSWAGFSKSFSDPAPWYFRTMTTWENLFETNGFMLGRVSEPINRQSKKAASIVFVGKLARYK